MFGSNFDANFGIPAFPVQGMDPQGGLFGATAPDQGGDAMPGAPAAPPAAAPAMAGPPAAGAQPALGASPLSPGALAPGAAAPPAPPAPAPDQGMGQAPPAAGIGSPFGKVGV